ncbi:protein of unknown function [Candidatus Nitrosocosmicus franklandus]|uniref:Uncharacterized protein n=1 Tax=Candidatus Nitrosocosmicus franklandianus TaxID=1798806 RepID=A0A484I7K9_9ARCH|nr:protein of unknown function [Candidatus Nitrosocosmicus franklandus]
MITGPDFINRGSKKVMVLNTLGSNASFKRCQYYNWVLP